MSRAAVKQARLRKRAQGIPLDPNRFQYCAKPYHTFGSVTLKCDLRQGHDGPCAGDAVATVFRGFTDEEN